jgi:hypothetical protein
VLAQPGALLAVGLLVAALVLPACGGEDDEPPGGPATTAETTGAAPDASGVEGGGDRRDQIPRASPVSSDEELVEAAVLTVLAGRDARSACGEAMTESFLRTAYGDRGGCIAARDPATLADRGTTGVRAVEIDGQRATAIARPQGGTYDGERLEVGLQRVEGGWRVDRLSADIPVGP